MAAHGYGNNLKGTKEKILPDLITMSKNEKTLEQLKLHSVTMLARSYCILKMLSQIFNKLYRKYQAIFFCFLFKKKLGYLKSFLDMLLRKKRWRLINIKTEKRIVLRVP